MFRFRMSGKLYEFDEQAEFTAGELFDVADIIGASADDDLGELVTRLATSVSSGHVTLRGAKALLCIAWLSHRRGGGTLDWSAFTHTVVPSTIEVLDESAAAGGDGGPQRESATRQRPRGRKSGKR